MESTWTTGKRICKRSTLESSQTLYQGILHSTTPSAEGEAPALISTGRPVAREEEGIGSTISNADICNKAADHELRYSCGYSTEFYGWAAKTANIGTSI